MLFTSGFAKFEKGNLKNWNSNINGDQALCSLFVNIIFKTVRNSDIPLFTGSPSFYQHPFYKKSHSRGGVDTFWRRHPPPPPLIGCVCYIFACLFCMSRMEHLRNKEKCFSQQGQISLRNCIYFPGYSVKFISCFMLRHLITSWTLNIQNS